MSLLWQFKQLEEKIEKLKNKVCCVRCKRYYDKNLDQCPLCQGIPDDELLRQLEKRDNFRVSLGRVLIYLALLITFAVIALSQLL